MVLATSTWIVVLGVNQLWLSFAVIVVAQVVVLLRLRNLSVLLATLVLAIPMSLSMALIHVPFGDEVVAPLVTADGLLVAAELSMRFIALISVFLACVSAITVPELVKAVQGHPWLGSRVAYVIGSSVQLLPKGREALAAVRDANQLRGRSVRGPIRSLKYLALPLITRLLSTGAARAIPLEVAGMDRRGPRTVLRPAVDPPHERVLRWFLPLLAIGVILWV